MNTNDTLLIERATALAENKLEPIAALLDEEGRAPTELIGEMVENGLFGMRYPKELGGLGCSAAASCRAIAALAKASAGVALLIEVHNMAVDVLLKFGSAEQKAKWVPSLLAGECLAAYTISEAVAGSDAASITTQATRIEGGYVLNGAKYFCTNGGIAELYIIAAKTAPEAGAKGISLFAVEMGTPGFSVGPNIQKLGCRSSAMTALSFKDCFVDGQSLIGPENGGFKAAMFGLNGGRLGMAAMGLGIAEAATGHALAYANRRQAFGAPLAKLPAVQAMAADMLVKTTALRHMLLAAAGRLDAGEDFSQEASMAKIFAAEAVAEVTHKALQICGGHGYVKGNPCERYFRDARLMDIGVGATEVLKTVVGSSVLRSHTS